MKEILSWFLRLRTASKLFVVTANALWLMLAVAIIFGPLFALMHHFAPLADAWDKSHPLEPLVRTPMASGSF